MSIKKDSMPVKTMHLILNTKTRDVHDPHVNDHDQEDVVQHQQMRIPKRNAAKKRQQSKKKLLMRVRRMKMVNKR